VRQQPIDDLHVFTEAGDAFLGGPVVDTHHSIRWVDLQPGAEAKIEAAAGYVVGGQCLQREQGGVTQGNL